MEAGGVTCTTSGPRCNHPATWHRGYADFICTFLLPSFISSRLLNSKSKSLGMLTIQSRLTLAALSRKCLTKQSKQQLQLCFFFFPPPPLLSRSQLWPQMMYSVLHRDIHMERLEDFRLKLIFVPLGSGKSQKLLLAHL